MIAFLTTTVTEVKRVILTHLKSLGRAVLSNGPAGPGPQGSGGPQTAHALFLSREIIVTNCVIFHWPNK